MNRYGKYALCMLWVLLDLSCFSTSAQSYVGVSVAGHAPMTFDKVNITHSQINYGGEIGFVYEWHKNHFLFRTGVHYALLCPRLAVDSQHLEQDMIDTRGVLFTYRGNLDKRTDNMILGLLSVPLYLGGEWDGFYFLVGAKIGLNLHATAIMTAQLKTAGDYNDRYYDWFEDMPNHGYHDYQPVKTKHDITLPLLNVTAAAEIGYTVRLSGRNRDNLIRFGLFAEYGISDLRNNQLKNSTLPRTQPDYSQYMSVLMNHIYASQEAGKSDAHLFTCGLRITFLFPVSSSSRHHYPCRCYTL